MNAPLPPLHHSLLLNAQAEDGSMGCSLEFGIFRSKNGFVSRAEITAILEIRDPQSGTYQRKVFRAPLPFPDHLQSAQSLVEQDWECEGIRFSKTHFSGKVQAPTGDLEWNFEIRDGHPVDFSPLPKHVQHRTLRTQIPLQGSCKLGDIHWNSQNTPARASLHIRSDVGRIPMSVRFHAQFLAESGSKLLHCADGMHAKGLSGPLRLLPPLTSIQAFEALKGNPKVSLWRAARAKMTRVAGGWTFRSDQNGLELRGKIEVEPKHWITLRCEDSEGATFYRTSVRFARLEILVLSNGKPQGLYRSGSNTWLEWTSREAPPDSAETR